MSRSLGASFITEKNLNFARPFNSVVFHFGGAVGDVYVAPRDVTIGGNAHVGAISRWGEYRYIVSPRDGSFQVAAIQLDIINFPVFPSTKRFSGLWSGIGVEGIEADVYQNFTQVGGSTIFQEILFAAVVRPISYSPNICTIDLWNVSDKYLDKNEISFVLNATDLPSCDPDDIGKRANVIYGSPKGVPCHAVVAGPDGVLRSTITASTTTIPIWDEFYDSLATTGTIQIGAEQITYTGKGGSAGSRTLTGLTRGANSTTAAAHLKDDMIIVILSSYVYLAAGHEAKAIDAVYIMRGDKKIFIPAADYTANLANTTLISGKTLTTITFTTPPIVSTKDDLTLTDTIDVTNAYAEGRFEQSANPATLTVLTGNATNNVSPSYGSQAKTKSSGNFRYTLPFTEPRRNDDSYEAYSRLRVTIGATTVTLFECDSAGVPITNKSSPYVGEFSSYSSSVVIVLDKSNSGNFGTTTTCEIGFSTVSYLVSTAASKTGTVTAGNTSAEKVIGDKLLVDIQGYKDDGSGTYTGTANAIIEKPADVLYHLARIPGAIPTGKVNQTAFQTARTDSPASYAFAGNMIDRSSNLKELLLALGMQCRIRIEWPVDKLTARFRLSTYGAIAKVLTQEHVMKNDLRTTLLIQRTPVEDLINTIDLYYGRDWNKGKDKSAFNAVTKATDSTSITNYGTRQDTARFLFDFIAETNSTMANDLRDFYIALYKQPTRLISFECKLDQYEILPGDILGLDYKPDIDGVEKFDGLDGTQKLLVEQYGLAPGSARDNRGTRMMLTLREVS